jgi:hypothetical protein
MRQVRFFEDSEGPKDVDEGRRLLIGIMDCDESPAVDGGRREAVRVATMADATEFQGAYAEYYNSFQATAPDQSEQPLDDQPEPLRPASGPPAAG